MTLKIVLCLCMMVTPSSSMGAVKMIKDHNGNDPPHPEPCVLTCAGSTGYGKNNWRTGTLNAKITVDISECGFIDTPIVTSSLNGSGHNDYQVGMSSPRLISKSSFEISILQQWSLNQKLTKEIAEKYKFNINWIAVGHVC